MRQQRRAEPMEARRRRPRKKTMPRGRRRRLAGRRRSGSARGAVTAPPFARNTPRQRSRRHIVLASPYAQWAASFAAFRRSRATNSLPQLLFLDGCWKTRRFLCARVYPKPTRPERPPLPSKDREQAGIRRAARKRRTHCTRHSRNSDAWPIEAVPLMARERP
ncbi:hypothetical protein MTO96_025707 [Rhipicephalus appendiculatus]